MGPIPNMGVSPTEAQIEPPKRLYQFDITICFGTIESRKVKGSDTYFTVGVDLDDAERILNEQVESKKLTEVLDWKIDHEREVPVYNDIGLEKTIRVLRSAKHCVINPYDK